MFVKNSAPKAMFASVTDIAWRERKTVLQVQTEARGLKPHTSDVKKMNTSSEPQRAALWLSNGVFPFDGC